MFLTQGQPESSLLHRKKLHGRRQQQRHSWISAVAAASFIVSSLQAQTTSLSFSSFGITAPPIKRMEMMMTRRKNLSFLPLRSAFTVLVTPGYDRSLTGWFPLSKIRQTTVTRNAQNGNYESSSLKGHQNDNHDAKRNSSSTTGVSSRDYTKLPRLYVGDCHSTSLSASSPLFGNNNALLFHAEDWQTTPLQELLLRASTSRRADNKKQVQQQQQQHSLLMTKGATLSLTADQSHYLTTVLRLNKKKSSTKIPLPLVRIFDETGEWLAEVEPILSMENDAPSSSQSGDNKKKKKNQIVSVTCLQPLRQQQHKRRICWMAVALPKKKDRSRWLIEKCTELGVAGFILLDTDYSESSSSSDDGEAISSSKLFTYAMEAAEQSERLDLPCFVTLLDTKYSSPDQKKQGKAAAAAAAAGKNGVVTTKLTTLLDAWLWNHINDNTANENGNSPSPRPFLLACRERVDHSVSAGKVLREQILNQIPSSESAIAASDDEQQTPQIITLFLVGPEGGWSPEEQARFDELQQLQQEQQSHQSGAADGKRIFMWNVSLGPNILRAETAAVTAAAAHALVLDECDS